MEEVTGSIPVSRTSKTEQVRPGFYRLRRFRAQTRTVPPLVPTEGAFRRLTTTLPITPCSAPTPTPTATCRCACGQQRFAELATLPPPWCEPGTGWEQLSPNDTAASHRQWTIFSGR